ncbi:MAG TPA: tetratricopeptide repeat protein [Opitutaceae bacterium]|nr:tetratricopeptide repeat protein [Opitutaceae bacterium]
MTPFKLVALLLAAAGTLAAQESLIGPVLFAPAPNPVSPAGLSFVRLAAPQAQEMGLPEVAASLYRQALAAPGANRPSLDLALAASLLDAGRAEEADAVLDSSPDHGSALWHLRKGLTDLALRRIDEAREQAQDCVPGDLTPEDRAWYDYLQGVLAGIDGDSPLAQILFRQAEAGAESGLARARFLLAETEQSLRHAPPTPDQLQEAQAQAERSAGQPLGYDYARALAVMLDELGRKPDALRLLAANLARLRRDRGSQARVDDFHLLAGVIGGAEGGAGRAALEALLERGGDEDRRRVALEMLAEASRGDPQRAEFRRILDRMIADPANARSPLLDDLLLYRAREALEEGSPADAIAYADRLLTAFPGSELKPDALAVQTRGAWNQERYRAAAALAGQAREATAWADGKALFGVVAAEAWFRAGLRGGDPADFRSAGAAYAAVIRRPPAGMPLSELRFQRVESEILAGALGRAAALIDEMARSPDFNVVDRWRCELNLAFALQQRGDMAAAYARVNRVLREPPGVGMPPELHGRMAWLQADLAYENGQYEEALRLAGGLDAATARVPEALRAQIRAWGPLLEGRALFALGRDAAARAALERLRAEWPRSDAAVESFLTEAAHAAAAGQVPAASRLLLQLADQHPDSGYADTALFQAAQLAERVGTPAELDRARELIERLIKSYPDSPLTFDARLEEGNLLRSRNRFDLAQQTYESLLNNPRFARAPDRVLAELALGDCHSALAADPGHAEKAASLYQDVLEREDLEARPDGTDIRVEAGCKLGELYRRGRQDAEAQNVWFGEVIDPFLLHAAALGSTGRYWMARTVLDLGDLLLADGRAAEAKTALEIGEKAGLLDAALVRKRLSLSGAPAPD